MNQPYIETHPSPRKWKITKLEKVRGERNGRRHNAFIFIHGADGERLDGFLPKIEWTWVGRQNDQIPNEPQPKSAPDEYDYDIPLEQGVYASIKVRGVPSDVAHAVTSMLPDEDEWNVWGHHSWEIWFQWQEEEESQPQPQPQRPQPQATTDAQKIASELNRVISQLSAIAAKISAL